MNARKLLCYIGIHQWKTVGVTDCFCTEYTDRPQWGITYHMVWYQKCGCCGKRRLKDSIKQDRPLDKRHNGVEFARVDWVEKGQMYLGERNTTVNTPPPKPRKPKLRIVK